MSASQQSNTMRRYKYFSPNTCDVCWKIITLHVICDQCRMIFYCSVNHKQLNYQSHIQICTALQKLLESHPQFWDTCGLSQEEWVQTRKKLLCLTKRELQRDLELHEEQMIVFAKSCFICHKQKELMTCTECFSVNYCADHANHIQNHRSSNCEELRVCHWLNSSSNEYPDQKRRFVLFPDVNKPVVDMDTFIKQFVHPKPSASKHFSSFLTCHYYSDYMSGPLTLYYGMQKINVLNYLEKPYLCYVIHIIAADSIDREYLPAWEVLLHLLPNVRELKIILIGPVLYAEYGNIELCVCRCLLSNKQQQLSFECHRMLYHNYVGSEWYTRPNVIVGFQANLRDWEILSEWILNVQAQNCPFLLTAKSKLQAEQNVTKIVEILKSFTNNVLYIVYNNENKFSSIRPYRDLQTNGVFYRNKYLTIYWRL